MMIALSFFVLFGFVCFVFLYFIFVVLNRDIYLADTVEHFAAETATEFFFFSFCISGSDIQCCNFQHHVICNIQYSLL